MYVQRVYTCTHCRYELSKIILKLLKQTFQPIKLQSFVKESVRDSQHETTLHLKTTVTHSNQPQAPVARATTATVQTLHL